MIRSSEERTGKRNGNARAAFRRVQVHLTASLWVWALAAWCVPLTMGDPNVLFDFYRSTFRTPFFTGFLTLGSFLLSFKSFAILRLATVFDTDEYRDRHLERQRRIPGYRAGYMDPLSNLSDSVFLAIFLAMLTSAAQLTIGLIPYWWTTLACLWLSIFTAIVLMRTVRLLKQNIDIWLGIEASRLEDKLEERRRVLHAATTAKDEATPKSDCRANPINQCQLNPGLRPYGWRTENSGWNFPMAIFGIFLWTRNDQGKGTFQSQNTCPLRSPGLRALPTRSKGWGIGGFRGGYAQRTTGTVSPCMP